MIRHISDPLVRVLFVLIAITGMRISEALALTWACINWMKGEIRILRKHTYRRKSLPELKRALGKFAPHAQLI